MKNNTVIKDVKHKILLIDNDAEFNEAMTQAFGKKYDFEIVEDFEEALNLKNWQKYDLILVDIYDGENEPIGIEIINRINSKAISISIPIIALSIETSAKLHTSTLNVGADRFLSKREYDAKYWESIFDQFIKTKVGKELSVFLSHASRDKPFTLKLEKRLREEGIEVWIDERIAIGESIPKKIFKHLEEAKFFVVILSENSVNSKWVEDEVNKAVFKANNEEEGTPYIVPIRYCKCKTPSALKGKKWIDFEEIQPLLIKLENFAFGLSEEKVESLKNEIDVTFEAKFQELLKIFKTVLQSSRL